LELSRSNQAEYDKHCRVDSASLKKLYWFLKKSDRWEKRRLKRRSKAKSSGNQKLYFLIGELISS
jgi:hypothetical protein